DLARSCFRQSTHKLNLIWLGYRADKFGDGLQYFFSQLIFFMWLIITNHKGIYTMSFNIMRIAHYSRLTYSRVFINGTFNFGCTQVMTRYDDNIINSP